MEGLLLEDPCPACGRPRAFAEAATYCDGDAEHYCGIAGSHRPLRQEHSPSLLFTCQRCAYQISVRALNTDAVDAEREKRKASVVTPEERQAKQGRVSIVASLLGALSSAPDDDCAQKG